jgi:hypothetical protein
VLCHYLPAHGVTPNVSPNVSPDMRYAIFFRIKVPGHDEQRNDLLWDIWREWPGIREAAGL